MPEMNKENSEGKGPRAFRGAKRNRTPDEAGMQLLYAPYVPNKAEYLILTNRRIFADQMEFLAQHVSAHSRLPETMALD